MFGQFSKLFKKQSGGSPPNSFFKFICKGGNKFIQLEEVYVQNSGKNVNDEITIDFTAKVAINKYLNFHKSTNKKEKYCF